MVSMGRGTDGKNKFKYKTYRVTEKMTPKQLKEHLEYEAYKFEQKVLSNAYISPSTMTFEQFSNEWIKQYLEKNVSESTIMNRMNALNTHILPVIGHLNINKINTMMLLDLMDNLKRCVLQVKSLELCNEKFRTLPAHIYINDLIKRISLDNYLL